MAVVLIQRCRRHPFIALFVTSLFLGLCAGMSPTHVIAAFEDGAGQRALSIKPEGLICPPFYGGRPMLPCGWFLTRGSVISSAPIDE